MKIDPSELPSPKRLQEIFRYEPETGLMRWRAKFYNRPAGSVAGFRKRDGYRYVYFERRCYLQHRIIWAVACGEWPAATVDHINMVRDDNRLPNLRLASVAENNRNRPKQNNNKSGFKGVCFVAKLQKFQAQVHHSGGSWRSFFATAEEAARAYDHAVREFHGEFATLNFPDEVAA